MIHSNICQADKNESKNFSDFLFIKNTRKTEKKLIGEKPEKLSFFLFIGGFCTDRIALKKKRGKISFCL